MNGPLSQMSDWWDYHYRKLATVREKEKMRLLRILWRSKSQRIVSKLKHIKRNPNNVIVINFLYLHIYILNVYINGTTRYVMPLHYRKKKRIFTHSYIEHSTYRIYTVWRIASEARFLIILESYMFINKNETKLSTVCQYYWLYINEHRWKLIWKMWWMESL